MLYESYVFSLTGNNRSIFTSMWRIKKRKIQEGVYWVEIPEADIRLLCGCPADSIKHLRKHGYVFPAKIEGHRYETGPNSILLSDSLTQNNSLSNLSEFPVLHMLYNQGMMLPGHPNNYEGNLPTLIGTKKQVDAQLEYIFRGNFGLISIEEFLQENETELFAKENLDVKLRFAYGEFTPPDELVKGIYLETSPIEIKNGVSIQRIATNVFTISYKDKSVKVDLNLKPHKRYKPSYILPKFKIPKFKFGVIHIGEGNGWDPTRPCTSSLVAYKKKFFVIDAGPFITESIKAVGYKVDQLEGVIFTHVHDDHFAGLYSLLKRKNKLKIFCTRVIKATVFKKFAALLSCSEKEVEKFLDFHELTKDVWNNYSGLEIKPIVSPHPVDTCIYIFRDKEVDNSKTYGHYSDIASLGWLKKMMRKDKNGYGISESFYNYVVDSFKLPLTVKKVDVGGPVIHGEANDFTEDSSERLILAHTTSKLTQEQLEIGVQAEFGDYDILTP